jgi:hypothetical protein
MKFQREQFAALLPDSNDLKALAFCCVVTVVFLAGYAAFSGVVMLVLNLISGV